MDTSDEKDTGLTSTRRDMLLASGLGLMVAAQPAIASAASARRPTGPAGHNRFAPAFRRVDLQK